MAIRQQAQDSARIYWSITGQMETRHYTPELEVARYEGVNTVHNIGARPECATAQDIFMSYGFS